MALLSLFLASLLAATLFPAQSEAVLLVLLAQGQFHPLLLVLVASTGNTLGACVNWWIGTSLAEYRQHRFFPISPQALERAQQRYQRHGRWLLLLSWLPVVGDPITLAAGLLRERFVPFLLLVGIGKTGRYLVLVAGYYGLFRL